MDVKIKRDHNKLHYLLKHPLEASTSNAMVKNDMYGISHTIVFEQTLLRPDQIKLMHDNWVKEYEPSTHTTPMNVQTKEEIVNVDRWNTVVIRNPKTKKELTKRDIFRYYANSNVKKRLFKQLEGKPIMVRQAMDTGDSWLKRTPMIRKNVGDAADPEDIQYFLERRNIEFHSTMETLTDRLVVDVDPGDRIKLDETKKVVAKLEKILQNQSYVRDVEIQFSGNRGFYLWGNLSQRMNINSLREKLKQLFSTFKSIEGIKTKVGTMPGSRTIVLDLSSMKKLGPIRAEGSLNYRTGYISTKVLPSQLSSFDPEIDAIVDPSILKPAYSFKDEALI